jgi:REP element-mobilizing transposase RayT
MARPWRIQYEDAYYHVLSRGNEGRDIFYDEQDRKIFLETLGEAGDRFGAAIYAFVLMTNHYHLLLQTGGANPSRAMQWFGVTDTRRFNNRHSRTGHLFQGRFKSMVVENDAYVVELSCYIHRNPLRAGMVERLIDYKKYASGRPHREIPRQRGIVGRARAEALLKQAFGGGFKKGGKGSLGVLVMAKWRRYEWRNRRDVRRKLHGCQPYCE